MRFIYTKPDGSVAIVHAAPKEHLAPLIGKPTVLPGGMQGPFVLSDEDYRAHVLERCIPKDATNVTEMPEDWQPPADRTFRNAWFKDKKAISVDMSKAREIWKENMREARAPMLAALDVEYTRADEAGDSKLKQQIAARRQALRDVTSDPRIKSAKTPDELKAVWPSVLGSLEEER